MHCTLTSLQTAAGAGGVENVFASAERRLLATTSGDGGVRVFRTTGETFELEPLRELQPHQAPVMALAFAPLAHRNYLLTVAYDRSLALFNLDDPKATEPVFSYREENKEIGFFTACTFATAEKGRLVFVAGTSTGDLLVFDSASHFEARRVPLANRGSVRSLSAGPRGETLVVFSAADTCLFFDLAFEMSVDFGGELHAGQKTSVAAFAPLRAPGAQELILTAGEDQRLGLWTLDLTTHAVLLVKRFELEAPAVAAFWNFSGLSFIALLNRKEAKGEGLSGIEIVRGVRQFEAGEDEWRLQPVALDRPTE